MRLQPLLTGLGLALIAGCAESDTAPRNPELYPLVDYKYRQQIVTERWDRERVRKNYGPPTIDDGEEWVYVDKASRDDGVDLGMLMAVTATLGDPVWTTAVVTFDSKGIVEHVEVGETRSRVGDEQRYGIFMGVRYDRAGRMRATSRPVTGPSATTTPQSKPSTTTEASK